MGTEAAEKVKAWREATRAKNIKKLAACGIKYECASCKRTNMVLDVYPPMSDGWSLNKTLLRADFSRIIYTIKNRLLLCRACRISEWSGKPTLTTVARQTHPKAPYVLRGATTKEVE